MSILLSWTKFAADLPPPLTTTVPEHLSLGSDNSSIGSRMRDTGAPLPIPPVNGIGSVLGKVVGLPSYQGMYSPQQFKIPQYGSEETLRRNIATADQYRRTAKLPPLAYDKIFDQVPLYQGAAADSMGGFVPFSSSQKTAPVFMGNEPLTKAIDSSSGTKAWLNGVTSTREQQQAAMQGKPMPGGFFNKLMQRAQSGGDMNSWKEYGALARSSGMSPTPENAKQILANTTNRSISGGNPADTMHDQSRVLEHELGHTWLKDPTANLDWRSPAADLERDVSNGVSGVNVPWYSSLRSLGDHDANLPEFLNYGSALQGHMFRTTGKRLETPEAVKQWTDDLLGSPDEHTFEQRLQPYPFDVRRMMRHNWRLQQGQGNDAKKELLESLKQRMQTWFPALVNTSSEASKVASLSRLLPAATNAFKFMARVPSNRPFAPTLTKGVTNALRVGFNPYLGKRMQVPKRILQGATLWGLGSGINHVRNQISDIGGQAASMIPDLPQTSAVKSYAQQLHESPLWTTARTVITGMPDDIPPAQRDFITQLGALGVKSKLYGQRAPADWKDYAGTVYKPALGTATTLLQKLLQRFIPPAGPKDYLNLAGSAYKMVQPPG